MGCEFESYMCHRSVRLHNTWVVSSNPTRFTIKSPMVRKATRNHLVKSLYLRTNSVLFLRLLLCLQSSMRRLFLYAEQNGFFSVDPSLAMLAGQRLNRSIMLVSVDLSYLLKTKNIICNEIRCDDSVVKTHNQTLNGQLFEPTSSLAAK